MATVQTFRARDIYTFRTAARVGARRLIGQFLCALIGASRSEFDAESAAAMFCVSLTFSININQTNKHTILTLCT